MSETKTDNATKRFVITVMHLPEQKSSKGLTLGVTRIIITTAANDPNPAKTVREFLCNSLDELKDQLTEDNVGRLMESGIEESGEE
jgi:hypothetical protein